MTGVANAKLAQIANDISSLTLLETAELNKILEEKLGVSAQPAFPAGFAMPVAGGSADDGASAAEAKSEFDVILSSVGDSKISIIKVIRELTGGELADVRKIVDAGAGAVVAAKLPKEKADEYKSKLEAAGASVELK